MRVVLRRSADRLACIVDDDVEPLVLLLDPTAELLKSSKVTKVDAIALQA
jgi:hypothetical protein